jgi:PilZ domain
MHFVGLVTIPPSRYFGVGESNKQVEAVDQRQNKRYRLKTAVKFSWESQQGGIIRGEGFTRDISPSGVFVLAGDRLPLGTTVKLEIVLPSPRKEVLGASLRTRGHVVRSEQQGFAAVAEMGFRMQFPGIASSRSSRGESGGSKQDASREEVSGIQRDAISRFWM